MARQERIDASAFGVHIAAISTKMTAKLGPLRLSGSFEYEYLKTTTELYFNSVQSIKKTLVQLAVGKSCLYQISSNCLPFLFLPEKTATGINMVFSQVGYDLLQEIKQKIMEFNLHHGEERINTTINHRLEKINKKLELANTYLTAQREFENLTYAMQSKIDIMQQLTTEPEEEAIDIFQSIIDFIARHKTSIIAPYREEVKENFSKKNKAFLNGPIKKFFAENEIKNVISAMSQSAPEQNLDLSPALNELARTTFEAIKTSNLSPDKKQQTLEKLNTTCHKKKLTTYNFIFEPPLPPLHSDIKADSMEGFIKRFVYDFVRLRLLLATVNPEHIDKTTQPAIDLFFTNTLERIAMCCATLTPTIEKKHQHGIIDANMKEITQELRKLLAAIQPLNQTSSNLEHQFIQFIEQMIDHCNTTPDNEYKKPIASKIKSCASALTKRAKPTSTTYTLKTYDIDQSFWNTACNLMQKLKHASVAQKNASIGELLKQSDVLSDLFIDLFKLTVTAKQTSESEINAKMSSILTIISAKLTAIKKLIGDSENEHAIMLDCAIQMLNSEKTAGFFSEAVPSQALLQGIKLS